jgi:hypothetical protein
VAKTRTVYVVLHQSWSYNDETYDGDDTPIKAFTRKDEAEAYCERCRAAHDRSYDDGDTQYAVVPMQMPE